MPGSAAVHHVAFLEQRRVATCSGCGAGFALKLVCSHHELFVYSINLREGKARSTAVSRQNSLAVSKAICEVRF